MGPYFLQHRRAVHRRVCAIYYLIPNIKQHVIAVAPGAAIVVVGWLGAAYFFTLYLSNFNQVNLIYGSLGGIIAALVFFYVCNIIFIFGAEFNYQIVHTLGLRIVEKENAASSPSAGTFPIHIISRKPKATATP